MLWLLTLAVVGAVVLVFMQRRSRRNQHQREANKREAERQTNLEKLRSLIATVSDSAADPVVRAVAYDELFRGSDPDWSGFIERQGGPDVTLADYEGAALTYSHDNDLRSRLAIAQKYLGALRDAGDPVAQRGALLGYIGALRGSLYPETRTRIAEQTGLSVSQATDRLNEVLVVYRQMLTERAVAGDAAAFVELLQESIHSNATDPQNVPHGVSHPLPYLGIKVIPLRREDVPGWDDMVARYLMDPHSSYFVKSDFGSQELAEFAARAVQERAFGHLALVLALWAEWCVIRDTGPTYRTWGNRTAWQISQPMPLIHPAQALHGELLLQVETTLAELRESDTP